MRARGEIQPERLIAIFWLIPSRRAVSRLLEDHVEAFDAQGASLGVVCRTATPLETPWRMADLIAWAAGRIRKEAFIRCRWSGSSWRSFSFQDGEGRLSRLLTTLLLLRAGYGWALYSSLDHVIEQEKEAYYSALQRTQGAIRAEGAPPDLTL